MTVPQRHWDVRAERGRDTLFFEVAWTGVSGTFAGAHIHAGGDWESGPVVFDLGPFVNGNTAAGWWALTEENLEDLEDDELYVNVHSTEFPDGEIRGQLRCEIDDDVDDEDEGEPCTVALSGDAEVPPNDSEASGTAVLTRQGHTVYFNIMWDNLEGDFSGAHFHRGDEDESGPVISIWDRSLTETRRRIVDAYTGRAPLAAARRTLCERALLRVSRRRNPRAALLRFR